MLFWWTGQVRIPAPVSLRGRLYMLGRSRDESMAWPPMRGAACLDVSHQDTMKKLRSLTCITFCIPCVVHSFHVLAHVFVLITFCSRCCLLGSVNIIYPTLVTLFTKLERILKLLHPGFLSESHHYERFGPTGVDRLCHYCICRRCLLG